MRLAQEVHVASHDIVLSFAVARICASLNGFRFPAEEWELLLSLEPIDLDIDLDGLLSTVDLSKILPDELFSLMDKSGDGMIDAEELTGRLLML